MDKTLYDLWQSEQYPFNQVVYKTNDLIKLDDLYEILISLAKFLKDIFSNKELLLNHDWHEHDGYITLSEKIQWSDVDRRLESTKSLYDTRDGDDYVRITIYSSDLNFILRYYVLDEDDDMEFYPGIWGDFDLTIDKIFANEIDSVLNNLKINSIDTTYPKHYFDENYGG